MAILTKMKKPNPSKAHEYFHHKNEFTTGPIELDHLRRDPGVPIRIVDVRAREDYHEEHVPGSINLPQDEWESEKGLSKDSVNVFICYSQQCHLASKAAEKFSAKGYPVMEMDGGFKAWKENGLEVQAS